MKKYKNFILLFILIALTACATQQSFSRMTFNSLETSTQFYIAARKSLAELDAKGILTQEQKIKIVLYAHKFWEAHQAALDAYDKYLDTKDESIVYLALSSLTTALNKFIEYSDNLELSITK